MIHEEIEAIYITCNKRIDKYEFHRNRSSFLCRLQHVSNI